MHLKENSLFLILSILSVCLNSYSQVNESIDYDYLSGEYSFLDSAFTGELISTDTINGKVFFNHQSSLKNGMLHGRIERNIWRKCC